MKTDTKSFYQSAVRAAALRIQDSLDEALDLAALARGAALSPLHFHRIFRGFMGETAVALHRRLRLERAAHELASGDAPVTRIAFDAGYETHESFTRAFGERFGESPTAYRQRALAARAGGERAPETNLAARSGLHFRPGRMPESFRPQPPGETVMHVELETLSALRGAAVAHVGPYPNIGEAFGRLGEIAGRAGLLRQGETEMLALYHDDPDAVPAAELRSDAAITVAEAQSLPAGLHEIRLPGGRYAMTTHLGPYSGLGDSWANFMGGWLPSSGERLGEGPSFEIYRNHPGNAAPLDLRTELYMPLV